MKQKTRSIVKNRVSKTGSGKIRFKGRYGQHLLSSKSKKTLRGKSHGTVVETPGQVKTIRRMGI